MTPPVIKNSWDMDDSLCFLTTPQDQIKILCSIIFRTECTHLIQNCSFYNKNMTDIIILSEPEQIKIRFEIRLKIMFSIHADLIFICIDHISIFLSDRFYNMKKCIRCKNIIMITEHDIIAHRKPDSCIGIFGNPFVFF